MAAVQLPTLQFLRNKLCLLCMEGALLVVLTSPRPDSYSSAVLTNPFVIFTYSQDHCWPYMLGPRHAEDTLFILSEQYWRCYEVESRVKSDAVTDKRVTASASSAGEPSAPADAAPTEEAASAAHEFEPDWGGEPEEPEPAFELLAICNDDTKRIEGVSFFFPFKPTLEEGSKPTLELQDIVAYCTAASRLGRGNLVWLSWNPYDSKDKQSKLCSGTTLVAMTKKKKGAEHILRLLQHVKPMHFDVCLSGQLRAGEDEPSELGACYTWPSIGC